MDGSFAAWLAASMRRSSQRQQQRSRRVSSRTPSWQPTGSSSHSGSSADRSAAVKGHAPFTCCKSSDSWCDVPLRRSALRASGQWQGLCEQLARLQRRSQQLSVRRLRLQQHRSQHPQRCNTSPARRAPEASSANPLRTARWRTRPSRRLARTSAPPTSAAHRRLQRHRRRQPLARAASGALRALSP